MKEEQVLKERLFYARDANHLEVLYEHQWRCDLTSLDFLTWPIEDFVPMANELLAVLKCNTISSFDDAQWDEIEESEAKKLCLSLNCFSQAFSDPLDVARTGSRGLSFFAPFAADSARFLANTEKVQYLRDDGTELPMSGCGSGDGLSGATFDTGVLAIAPDRVGLLWFFEED